MAWIKAVVEVAILIVNLALVSFLLIILFAP